MEMYRIRELRKEKKLLQRDVAKYLKMSQTGYSKYECEVNDIPTKVLISLAKFYDVTVDYILRITDKRK